MNILLNYSNMNFKWVEVNIFDQRGLTDQKMCMNPCITLAKLNKYEEVFRVKIFLSVTHQQFLVLCVIIVSYVA